jgi:hypothetical protein
MGSSEETWIDRCASARLLGRTGIKETDEPLFRRRLLEDLSEIDNSLFVGDSRATERRSGVEEDGRLRVRASVLFAIVLSKAATAIASKPTGFCVRDALSKKVNWGSRPIMAAGSGQGRVVGTLGEGWTNHTWDAYLEPLLPVVGGTFAGTVATVRTLIGEAL